MGTAVSEDDRESGFLSRLAGADLRMREVYFWSGEICTQIRT